MIRDGEEIIGVICGPSMSGKSTLAAAIADSHWRNHRLLCLALDPIGKTKWGPTVVSTRDAEKFRAVAWRTHGLSILWEEATDSLDRNRDQKFTTRLRHQHKAIHIITHDLKKLDPTARGNLNVAYIFRQSEERARDWCGLFADKELMQTADLQQYEFIVKRPFQPLQRMRPTLEELARL